jgi:hypothetical protein
MDKAKTLLELSDYWKGLGRISKRSLACMHHYDA